MTPPAAGPRKLPPVVWATAWVSFFADASTELIYGVLPAFYLGTLSVGIAWLGVIEGLAETIVSITKLYSGYFSDRSGRRKIWMLCGYGLSALAKPLTGLAGGGVAVGALRAADRFGKGLRGAPRDALVAGAVTPTQRGRAFGIQRGMDHAGALLGGGVAAALLAAALVTPRQLFFLAALPGLACVLVVAFFIRDPAAAGPGRGDLPFSPRRAWQRTGRGFKTYLWIAGLFALANSSDVLLLAVCYERFLAAGIPEAGALARLPLLWALLHVVKALGAPLAGRGSDRAGRIAPLALAWVVYGLVYLGVALFSLGGSTAWSVAIFAGYGLVAALMEAPHRALIADLEPDARHRGAAFGVFDFAHGLLALPATLGAVALWRLFGPAWSFAAGGLLALAAAVVLAAFRPGAPLPSPPS